MSEYTIEVRTWYTDNGEYVGRKAEWQSPDSLNAMARAILDKATDEFAGQIADFQMPGTVSFPCRLSDWGEWRIRMPRPVTADEMGQVLA